MRDKYYPPQFNKNEFHCIHCGVFAHQRWQRLKGDFRGPGLTDSDFSASRCVHCGQDAFWYHDISKHLLHFRYADVPPNRPVRKRRVVTGSFMLPRMRIPASIPRI